MESIGRLFQANLDIVFLIYGLSFLTMGIALLAQPKRAVEFKFSNILWLLAVYAFLHAPADFLDAWGVNKGTSQTLYIIGQVLTYTSYLFLFEFGRRLMGLTKKVLSWLILPIIAVGIMVISALSGAFWTTANILIGYFVRFPAGIMAGMGFIWYYNLEKKGLKPLRVKGYFYTVGALLLAWSFFCGIVRARGSFFPANWLNTDSFFLATKIPVYVFRSLCALIISVNLFGMLGYMQYRKETLRLLTSLMLSIFLVELGIMYGLHIFFPFLSASIKAYLDSLILIIISFPLVYRFAFFPLIAEFIQRRSTEEKLISINQQLAASEQQLKATNQQLRAAEQQLRAANQQLKANNLQLQREINERKQAEAELLMSEERLRTVLGTVKEGITFSDEAGHFELYNLEMERLTGYSKEEANTCADFIKLIYPTHEEQGRAFKGLTELLSEGMSPEAEMTILTKNGQKKSILVRSSLLLFKGKKMFLSVYLDITGRKEIEKEQRLAQLGRLVSDMAHEVNNPLMIISGNAQLCLMEELTSQAVKDNLKVIVEECRRAKDIIQRLLIFSRPSKGERKEIELNKTIDAVIAIIEHQFSLTNIELSRKYTDNLPLISADEKQLQEVLINLFSNAKEAMPSGGLITIRTSLEENSLRLDIEDTGCGMSEEVLGRIPEPFFTTKEKGTGLGLAICQSIIKAHHGQLKFESAPQKGTTATIRLPVRSKE